MKNFALFSNQSLIAAISAFVLLVFKTHICSASQTLLDILKNQEILAFGDSLTHGMYVEPVTMIWTKTHPYAIKLRELFPADLNVTVIEAGVSGEGTQRMVTRLSHLQFLHAPTLTVILGGTNDLVGTPGPKILDNILKLHSTMLRSAQRYNKATFTIAMTIPQMTWGDETTQMKRLEVNKGIREFTSRCKERIILFEMESLFDQKVESNLVFWSPDKVHFSPLGYDKIAELLFDSINNFQLPNDMTDHIKFMSQCFHKGNGAKGQNLSP